MPHTSLVYYPDHLGLDEEGSGTWTIQEHRRFLEGVRLYPDGPWKRVADIVRTRSVRQIRTHAQKCKEKIARHERGLRIKPARRRKAMHCVDGLSSSSNSPRSPSSPESLMVLLDPLSVDQVDKVTDGCEPLVSSCSQSQLEECLVFLSDVFDDHSTVQFEMQL
ncbi:Aste57867_9389 [Aphanomyces stellatus]|uniref:Aste57867_9389 protein n=1 Tax=Aphanomyces stellatus TaxID=120398 RepID=A0A485KN32_9STRA|nr:hypothetical protein As57867_009353 [Aphanomyces stellatus]VFT86269.1 Aste57867_9389 [Aphanomyces stellatus]